VKFLVIWHFKVTRQTPDVIRAIGEQPKYDEKLAAQKKTRVTRAGLWR